MCYSMQNMLYKIDLSALVDVSVVTLTIISFPPNIALDTVLVSKAL